MTDTPLPKNDTRLIERWLPIATLGAESVRERTPMTPYPAPNRLHVWWARRPLIASRAAVLASVLPESADRERFLLLLGVHGDPVRTRRLIDKARKTADDLGVNPYGYDRAFKYNLSDSDLEWLNESLPVPISRQTLLDPTAGGGAIPFEALRLGMNAYSNDLNPVATLIEKATIAFPRTHGPALLLAFQSLSDAFMSKAAQRFRGVFPAEPQNVQVLGYLWARTINCPYCDALLPLSPNWRLAPDGTGVRLVPVLKNGPNSHGRVCNFEIVRTTREQSGGTISGGDATCPFSDCRRVVDGEEIKRQAQAGDMGEQLFSIIFKRRVETRTKSGNQGGGKWERGYRAPAPADNNDAQIKSLLEEKMDEWLARDFVPNESFPPITNDDRPIQYGMPLWRDMYSPRQLLVHGTGVEIFRELLAEYEDHGRLGEIERAAFVYLSLALDKFLNWNARLSSWNEKANSVRSVFDRHDFSFKWSYAEMPAINVGLGYEWVIEQTRKCIEELIQLSSRASGHKSDLFSSKTGAQRPQPTVTISCKSGDNLDHIEDASVDVVVIDPPYYDNVMYAELSDFFYVWLKRTAGHVMPELFTRQLTDKDREAVANPSKFTGEKGAKALAGREYQERMAQIFEECRRVLRPNGIMTLMFTHKATGAWDALTKGLIQAGFKITASWPINTEAEGSLHIRDKSAANSTIFLVCRPRVTLGAGSSTAYWEDVEPLVARAVRTRVAEFQAAGIVGVDLYLACFGPALEEFSRHWPLRRGTPRAIPESKRRRKQSELFEEQFDPYGVSPEDALDAARREVKRWRLEQLTHMKTNEELDPLTSFFVLAWDAFKAPVFPYDEALRLGRAVGVDLDTQVVGVLCEKKGSDLLMWDSGRRAAKGALGSPDGHRSMIDAIHHAAHTGRTRTLAAAKEALVKAGVDREPMFFAALEAVLEVLPVSKAFSGITLEGDLGSSGSDFEALENLRKLAFAQQVDQPTRLKQFELELLDPSLA